MPFNIHCTNKGCGHQTEALLNENTDQVECRDCGKEIANITSFAKVQLKSLGQVSRRFKTQEAFSVKCTTCQKEVPPKLSKSQEIVCGACASPLTTLSAPFRQILKDNLRGPKKNL